MIKALRCGRIKRTIKMLNEDVESLCIFNRSRNSSVYTLSLLSLLELASHTNKLTLYTTMASHTDKQTVFNSRFFSLYNLYFSLTSSLYGLNFHTSLIQTQWTRCSIYTNNITKP